MINSQEYITKSASLCRRLFLSMGYWIVILLIQFVFIDAIRLDAQPTLPLIQKVEDQFDQLGTNFDVALNPIVEDSLGYLWIASNDGLAKYSGSTIKTFKHQRGDSTSLSGNNIENIFLDSRQHLWVCIRSRGINILDPNGQKIKEFKFVPNDASGILANRVWGIFEDDDGYIWISYFSGGLSRYDYEKDIFEHFTIDSKEFLEDHRPKTIVRVVKDASEKHTFWFGTTRGLVKFNTRTSAYETFLFYADIHTQEGKLTHNSDTRESIWTRTMIQDRSGIIWLGMFGAMIRFDPTDQTYQAFYDEHRPFISNVLGILDFNEEYLLLSQSTGLLFFSKKDFSYTDLTTLKASGDQFTLNSRIFKSKNGCIYFTNMKKEKPGIFQICDPYKNVQDVVTGSLNASIAGTENFVHYFIAPDKVQSRNVFTHEITTHPFSSLGTSSIRYMLNQKNDTILFSDVYHVYKYVPGSKPIRLNHLTPPSRYRNESLFQDRNGDFWIGKQRDGVFKYDFDQKKFEHYNQNSDPKLVYQDYIEDFYQDSNDDIWIATEQGWTIFDLSKNQTRNYHSDDIYEQYDIDLKVIIDFEQTSDNIMWILTQNNGVLKWDISNDSLIQHFGISNGIKSDRHYQLLKDGSDNLWIGSEEYLVFIDTKTNEVRNFGYPYGLSKSMYSLAMSKDEGTLYAGHKDGYYAVDIENLLGEGDPIPSPVITEVNVLDQPLNTTLYKEATIRLSHQENFVTFSFGSLNFHNPKEESYQYKLDGLDKHWKDALGKYSTSYTALQPGTYQFMVRVKTNGAWSDSAKQKIRILPPWYKTWWFKSIMVLFILASAIGAIKIYLNRRERKLAIEKRFSELEMDIVKAQLNPHFLFNSLNSIRYLFMQGKSKEGIQYITKFAKLLRMSLQLGEQNFVTLSEEIEFTFLYIKLEQLRFDEKFTLRHNIKETSEFADVKIPPFVMQPLVENAFWHGLSPSSDPNKELNIEINQNPNCLILTIEDNGVGVENTETRQSTLKKKSFGLNLIKERFELINAEQKDQYKLIVEPSSSYPSGTRASLIITHNS